MQLIDGEDSPAPTALALKLVLVHLPDDVDHVSTLEAKFPIARANVLVLELD